MPFASDCIEQANVCLNDLLVVQGQQKTTGSIAFQLRDYATGNPLDLSLYLDDSSSSSSSSLSSFSSSSSADWDGAYLLLKDMPGNTVLYLEKQLTIVDKTTGQVRLDAEEDTLPDAGMFIGVVELWNKGVRRKVVPLYFAVEPTLTSGSNVWPLTIAEVRLALRDSCPEINLLLDEKEYADKEIAFHIRRAVDYWNEVPPPIRKYTPATFPFHFNWTEAVIGQLMQTVAIWKLRNHLEYAADGVTVDDTRRWRDYVELGKMKWEEYKNWVKQKKIEINIDGGFAKMSSGYARYWWWNR